MKKAPITIVLVLFLGIGSFAQETKIAFGYGGEVNKNAEYGVGGGAILCFDVAIFQRFAVGLNVTMSGDDSYNGILETAAMVRWYFYKGFFAEADGGLIVYSLRDDFMPYNYLVGLRAGYRLPFGELFYVEGHVRGGYPFIFGAGAVVGFRK